MAITAGTHNAGRFDTAEDAPHSKPVTGHPVQFEPVGVIGAVACVLCGGLVADTDQWRGAHRQSHDTHNKVHGSLQAAARSYVPAPRYG